MTKEQERLYKKFLQLNQSAQKSGDPYILDPQKKLKRFCSIVTDEKAKDFLTAYRTGELQLEQTSDIDEDDPEIIATSPLEMYLWQLYIRCSGDLAAERKDSWTLFSSIIRELIEQETTFSIVPQSRVTNAFSKLFEGSFTTDIEGTKEAIIGKGERSIKFIIPGRDKDGNIIKVKDKTVSTDKLLLFLLEEYGVYKSAILTPSVKKYASLCGRPIDSNSIKNISRELAKDLALLDAIKFECYEKINGKWQYSGVIRISGGLATCFHGQINWAFSPAFIPTLNRMAPVDYPKEIWKQNSKTSGFYLLKYIAENYRMNGDRDISVKTLLERAPTIPKIEEVKQKRMSANQKIIRPFFKTLDDIDSLYYEFVNAEGKIIPVEKVTKYDVFESGKIRVDYDDYPKHEEREKAKEKRKKKIAEAKEKAMIKALEKKAELEVGLL